MKKSIPRLGFMIALMFTLAVPAMTFAHGGAVSITPESLVLRAGSEVTVEVGGLVETNEATFELKGMFGSIDLGTYKIKSDDFIQVLNIPANVEPGSYSLIVSGGGKSAKVVVTVK